MARPPALTVVPLAVVLALIALPALAENSANLTTQQDMRSIALQNWSTTEVTQARVQTTDGRVWNLAHGGVSRDEGSQVIVPAHDCIANITVTLRDGRTLQLAGLHACNNTEIVVRNDRITIPQQAVPGAKQHGTPG